MEEKLQNNEFYINLFGSLMATVFNPLQRNTVLPQIPEIDADKYSRASEEERATIIEEAMHNDPFWGKFLEKLKNEDSYISLMNATKEVDSQLAKLNKERWDIIKEWVIQDF